MSSLSFQKWVAIRRAALEEIENAHCRVGGSTPGRRYATQQINQAYAVLLSSHFQRYCRDLHSECVDHLTRTITPPLLQTILQAELLQNRKLDTGNPNPGNIGSDFNRFGLTFWSRAIALDARNTNRRVRLERMNVWRNAIAHQDFDPAKLGGTTTLRLETVRSWRQAAHGLTISYDAVMHSHISFLVGHLPW